MHILTFTTLFPNKLQPVHGIFIRNRMECFVKKYGHSWTVVAPVPWFPRLPFRTKPLYDRYARIEKLEKWNGYSIHHPRYLVTPSIGMKHYGAWMNKGAYACVKKIHEEAPIDIIDGHYIFPDGTAACEIAKKLGIPVILSGRGTDLNLYPQLKAIRPLIQKSLQQAAHVICVSSSLGGYAKEQGLEPQKLSIIGNGIDPELFHSLSQSVCREELHLPTDKTILLSVGHLIERKGFHILIEAFAKLNRQDICLCIVGEGPDRQRLQLLKNQYQLGDRLLFMGAKNQKGLPPWYSAADLFVLMSSREGWPNVVCEARACGLPVIATRVDGIEDIVKPSHQGILLNERTVSALIPALEEALNRTWNRSEIAQSGAMQTWDAVAEKLQPIFEKVLKKQALKL